MDMQLKPFDFSKVAARLGLPGLSGLSGTSGTGAAQGTSDGFAQVFQQALHNVSRTQNTAQHMQREVSMDNPAVSLEETMISMQKATIGFQATLQVRNRLVQAYSEIMNMQV